MDTVCPGCKGRYHVTTRDYRPKKTPEGRMFRLKPEIKRNGWPEFHPAAVPGDLICPYCESPYVMANGRVKVERHREGGA